MHSTHSTRGFNRFANSAPSTPLPPDRDIMEGLRPTALQTIAVPTGPSSAKPIEISNLQTIGSYNWTGAKSPTIIVPGSPPEWQNKATPYQVPADVGIFFIDQNGFRMPTAILLPLILAVEKMHENEGNPAAFDWAAEQLDIITDRNGLRKLMRWIDGANLNGGPDAAPPKEFRIDLQLAGRTVLFNRWEKRTRENYSGFSYGFNFEKASTEPAPGCEDSTGHHRIVKYDLNGLKMAVRFEVDACIPLPLTSTTKGSSSSSVDALADSLAGIAIASSKSQPPPSASTTRHGLTIKDGPCPGTPTIPHSSLVELTTRAERRAAEFDWNEAYPQLFFSQTPHHFLGVHNRGRGGFGSNSDGMGLEFKDVERGLQPNLRKLRAALDVIREVVVKHGRRGRLTLVCRAGRLQVYERVSQASCLPEDVMARFES
ncbi:hypothetical protein FB45DRAFT_898670 [Roridomyces roridus]|uniref:Geranylgeranyl pyrophosphate synthetase n=1 Tax=Roridomyces roridus TaxID=1738132 RepID=A0AAD7CCD9_9AGAR|nr:hypothetical protein FB45DRAFT_898670 [Roridomyces roridus]